MKQLLENKFKKCIKSHCIRKCIECASGNYHKSKNTENIIKNL